jgi:hypothetical protein
MASLVWLAGGVDAARAIALRWIGVDLKEVPYAAREQGSAEIVRARTPQPRGPHLAESLDRCLAGTAGRVIDIETRIHRWVDAKGVVHYADRPPAEGAGELREILVRDDQPVRISARGDGIAKPHGYLERARVDAVGLSRVLRGTLGVQADGRLALDIVFVANQKRFREIAGQRHLANSVGAYLPDDRRVVVRVQSNEAATFATMRHEIAHALVHEWLGRLPIALNEGLAEYFQYFRVAGLGGFSELAPASRRALRSAPQGGARPTLERLLRMRAPDFYGTGSRQNYARSLALVAVLLSDQPGRDALKRLAHAQRADSCSPVDAVALFDRHYPGGVDALAWRWQWAMQSGNLPASHL